MLKLLLTVVVAVLFCLLIVGAFSILVWLGVWSVLILVAVPLLWLSYSFVDEVIMGNGEWVMTNIQRWHPYGGDAYMGEWKEHGDYVLYVDHRAIVRDMQEQICKLKDDLAAARMEAGGYA